MYANYYHEINGVLFGIGFLIFCWVAFQVETKLENKIKAFIHRKNRRQAEEERKHQAYLEWLHSDPNWLGE